MASGKGRAIICAGAARLCSTVHDDGQQRQSGEVLVTGGPADAVHRGQSAGEGEGLCWIGLGMGESTPLQLSQLTHSLLKSKFQSWLHWLLLICVGLWPGATVHSLRRALQLQPTWEPSSTLRTLRSSVTSMMRSSRTLVFSTCHSCHLSLSH